MGAVPVSRVTMGSPVWAQAVPLLPSTAVAEAAVDVLPVVAVAAVAAEAGVNHADLDESFRRNGSFSAGT